MNADAIVGLLGLNLLYLFAGSGLTAAAAGVAGRRDVGPGLAVAYMAGLAATTLVVVELVIAGLRPSLPVVLGSGLALALGGFAVAGARGVELRRPRFWARSRMGALQPLGMAFAALAGVILVYYLTASWMRGVANYDAFTFWVSKALALHYYGLDVPLFRDVIIAQTRPLFAPVLQASGFALIGSGNTMAVDVQYVLLLCGFVAALGSLLRRTAPAVLVWPALLTLLVLPHVVRRALAPEGDLPWQYFFVLGTLCVALWAIERRSGLLPLAALFLAASVSSKREGAIGFAAIMLAVPFIVTGEGRRDWRRALAGAGFVVASAAPWWIWMEIELHQEGTATFTAVAAALIVSAAVWWARRFGRRAVVLLPVLAAVCGVPAWRLLGSGSVVQVGRAPQALVATVRDTFDPAVWLLAPGVGIALVLLALLLGRGRRVATFVLIISLVLFVAFAARLLSFPVSWYPHQNLVPTRRNVAALVLFWISFAPVLIAQLISGRELARLRLPAALRRVAKLRAPARIAGVLALMPAAALIGVAAARGDFDIPHSSCLKPVTNPADAAFVFGHTATYSAALALQAQVKKVGFKGTAIDADPCGSVRVLTPHLSIKVAREQQAEAKNVHIYGTIEQT